MRSIILDGEAFCSPEQKLFARHVQLYPARRSKTWAVVKTGLVFTFGALIAAAMHVVTP